MVWRFIKSCLYVLTLRCEGVDRLRTTKHRDEWTRTERIAESVHVSMCKTCRRTRHKLRILDDGLRSFEERSDDKMPQESRQRVLDAIRR